jgi:hypothetical protein
VSAGYRASISDARLRGVADHVRAWLFGRENLATQPSPPAPAEPRPAAEGTGDLSPLDGTGERRQYDSVK